MLTTPRKLKHILIIREMETNLSAVDNYSNCLKSLGQHVTSFALSGKHCEKNKSCSHFTPYQLQKAIEAFPNLQEIFLFDVDFSTYKDNFYEIDSNIRTVRLLFFHLEESKVVKSLNSFFKTFNFQKKSLEFFEILFFAEKHKQSPINCAVVENALENYNLLKYEEKYKDKIKAHTFKACFK